MSYPRPFGPYVLEERIAMGGMAEIFRAYLAKEGFKKRVCIKRIAAHFAESDEFVHMFRDEAAIAAQLQHANIVQVFDFGDVDETLYIAMEFIDGSDLRRLQDQAKKHQLRFAVGEVLQIAADAARGLYHAHTLRDEHGQPLHVVHRDISPHNILISRGGEVKVTDFGIAKAVQRATHTSTGIVKGKVAYMAPEQAEGKAIDNRIDQFALGIVMWEMLTGQRLFTGDHDMMILRNVVTCQIPKPSSLREDIPADVDALILRALHKSPDERFPDMNAFTRACTRILMSGLVEETDTDLARMMMRFFEASNPKAAAIRRTAVMDAPILADASQPHAASSGEKDSKAGALRADIPRMASDSLILARPDAPTQAGFLDGVPQGQSSPSNPAAKTSNKNHSQPDEDAPPTIQQSQAPLGSSVPLYDDSQKNHQKNPADRSFRDFSSSFSNDGASVFTGLSTSNPRAASTSDAAKALDKENPAADISSEAMPAARLAPIETALLSLVSENQAKVVGQNPDGESGDKVRNPAQSPQKNLSLPNDTAQQNIGPASSHEEKFASFTGSIESLPEPRDTLDIAGMLSQETRTLYAAQASSPITPPTPSSPAPASAAASFTPSFPPSALSKPSTSFRDEPTEDVRYNRKAKEQSAPTESTSISIAAATKRSYTPIFAFAASVGAVALSILAWNSLQSTSNNTANTANASAANAVALNAASFNSDGSDQAASNTTNPTTTNIPTNNKTDNKTTENTNNNASKAPVGAASTDAATQPTLGNNVAPKAAQSAPQASPTPTPNAVANAANTNTANTNAANTNTADKTPDKTPNPSNTGNNTGNNAGSNNQNQNTAATPSGTTTIPAKTDKTEEPAPVGTGSLDIDVNNGWAHVYIDGKYVDDTPLMRKVPAGKHTVVLKHDATGASQTFNVTVEANRVKKIIHAW